MNDQDLRFVEDNVVTLLRFSIGVIFIWLGLLKVGGYNPVFHVVDGTFPYFATPDGTLILGLAESLIGVLLLANVWPVIVHGALIVHLLGTLLAFAATPSVMFAPQFPILTLVGEFVFKNTALAVSGILVLIHERRRALEDD